MQLHIEIGHKDAEVTTKGELLDDFYHYHTLKKSEKKEKYWNVRVVLRPRAFVFNPEGWVSKSDMTKADFYVAVYYKGYYVRVEHGRSMLGPHKFELIKQVRPQQKVRLGCWLESGNFFSESKILKLLKKALKQRTYFASEFERRVEVILEDEEQGEFI